MQYAELFEIAARAREHSYAPYSYFAVGAALLCEDGSVFTGCNIENAAFTPTVCAERVAFFKAVTEGVRDFTAIAVAVSGKAANPPEPGVSPCGVCRQVMMEFCDASFDIIIGSCASDIKVYKLSDILPVGFGPNQLA